MKISPRSRRALPYVVLYPPLPRLVLYSLRLKPHSQPLKSPNSQGDSGSTASAAAAAAAARARTAEEEEEEEDLWEQLLAEGTPPQTPDSECAADADAVIVATSTTE